MVATDEFFHIPASIFQRSEQGPGRIDRIVDVTFFEVVGGVGAVDIILYYGAGIQIFPDDLCLFLQQYGSTLKHHLIKTVMRLVGVETVLQPDEPVTVHCEPVDHLWKEIDLEHIGGGVKDHDVLYFIILEEEMVVKNAVVQQGTGMPLFVDEIGIAGL